MSGFRMLKIVALCGITMMLTAFARPAEAAYCVYNKTRQLPVSVSTDKSSFMLPAGAHFCCKANDALCVPTPPVWKIEAMIERRPLWCGATDQMRKRLGITLPPNDSYLLVRDARAGTPLPTPAPADKKPATPLAPDQNLARAPIDVDVMTADGRVVTTLHCQFSG